MDERYIKYDQTGFNQPELPFKRYDKVNYKGVNGMRPYNGTFIWSVEIHDVSPSFVKYIIEHPDGFPKAHFTEGLADEFDDLFCDELQDGLSYVYADAANLVMVQPYVAK